MQEDPLDDSPIFRRSSLLLAQRCRRTLCLPQERAAYEVFGCGPDVLVCEIAGGLCSSCWYACCYHRASWLDYELTSMRISASCVGVGHDDDSNAVITVDVLISRSWIRGLDLRPRRAERRRFGASSSRTHEGSSCRRVSWMILVKLS
jgi:hypothetical protein